MKKYLSPEIDIVLYLKEDIILSSTPANEFETNGIDNADGSADSWVFEDLI